MCLAIPGKILDTDEIGGMRVGKVQFGGITRQTFLGFLPEARPGDYVLVHVGFALSKIDEREAEQTLRDLESMGLLAEELEGTPGDSRVLTASESSCMKPE